MTSTPFAVATYPALVGAVLIAKRKELGLSQAEVASTVGLTVSTWSRIENGGSALTIEQLAKAADTLGVAPSSILSAAEGKITELSKLGIATSPDRLDAAAIIASGAIPLIGASLLKAIGPVGPVGMILGGAGVAAFQWLSKQSKKTKD